MFLMQILGFFESLGVSFNLFLVILQFTLNQTMKLTILPSMFILPSLFMSAYAIVPKVESTPTYLRVTDVERTDSALRVGIKFQNLPGYWVKLSSGTRLISSGDTTLQYKLINTENIPLDQEIRMPPSGFHEGKLLFEKVPTEVKIVDMVETDLSDLQDNVMGIHIDESETRVLPSLITLNDILNNKIDSSEEWNGLKPDKYSNLSFYNSEGTAHLRGVIIDYSSVYGPKTFTVRSNDDILSKDKVHVGSIAEDGSFRIDIPVTYPQQYYFELGKTIHKNIFVIPGDTISLASCMALKISPRHRYEPEYFGFVGEPNDAVVVNILTDSLLDQRYSLSTLYADYYVKPSDAMMAETYEMNERLAQKLDSVVTDLPVLLGRLPISNFSKDLLSAYAIGEICTRMEDLEMNFDSEKGPRFRPDEEGKLVYDKGEKLSIVKMLAPYLKHKDLIYNNPLMLSDGKILVNRWEFNNLFHKVGFATKGSVELFDDEGDPIGAYVQADDISEPFLITDQYLDSVGVGNCFVAQMIRTKSFINNLGTLADPSSENLEDTGRRLTHIVRRNDADLLNYQLMTAYKNFVKDVMIAEDSFGKNVDSSIIIDNSPEGEILGKIIAPYKGNVLFLDFWGIGCGPCRSGMMHQKPLLEKLSDQPFRALYIANGDEGLKACKKWLRNEEIKGEHIFVSDDDWKRLCGLFNISGIPHGVLIGKDGRIINDNYQFYGDEPLLTKALAE